MGGQTRLWVQPELLEMLMGNRTCLGAWSEQGAPEAERGECGTL